MLDPENMTRGDELVVDRYDAMFPKDWLMETARETGLLKRMRVFSPVLLFWVLVLQVGVRFQTCLASLRRNYNLHADEALAHASFYQRFTPELVKFMHACVVRALDELSQLNARPLSDRLSRFKDLLVQDSTIIRVHENLAKKWPATRSRKAAAGLKLACLLSVVADGPKRVKLYGERVAEIKTLRLGPWVKDRLLLIDLGFYKHHAFHAIDQHGGSFISRLKESANPTIVRLNERVRGNSIDVEGMPIRDVLARAKRRVLDVMVEVSFKKRAYRGKESTGTKTFRVVAVRNDETGAYHAYITNLSVDEFSADDIASLYRCRWEVELVFREMKDKFCIDQLPTANPHAVGAMVWSGVLTLVLHRVAFLSMCELNPERAPHYSHEGSAQAFREGAADVFLLKTLDRQGIEYGGLVGMQLLESGAFHPHRETGVHLRRWLA